MSPHDHQFQEPQLARAKLRQPRTSWTREKLARALSLGNCKQDTSRRDDVGKCLEGSSEVSPMRGRSPSTEAVASEGRIYKTYSIETGDKESQQHEAKLIEAKSHNLDESRRWRRPKRTWSGQSEFACGGLSPPVSFAPVVRPIESANYNKRSRSNLTPKLSKCFHKSPATQLATTCALVTILTVLICLMANSDHRAQSYQLTNNLIANNLPPKFVQAQGGASLGATSEIVVRVKEGPQSIGKLIYTLKGEDPDDDPLTFGVLGSMASDLLRVENVPGNQANVYLRKELDRETTESHQVVITLTDGKLGRGNWITKSMLIIVEDVNDNYPVFGPHRTAISIREDARAPLVIETIEATDADEGRFGQVFYRLDEAEVPAGSGQQQQQGGQAGPTVGQIFQVDTVDGRAVISLVGQLDFEQRPLYQLRVLAIDRAIENERLSASTSILISVEDCEDQPPMFTFAPAITRIPEDLALGSPVVRVSAIDGDRGVNNPIKYALVAVNNQETGFERNLFSINSDTGQIVVAHELDRELTTGSVQSSSSSSGAGGSNQPGAYVLQVRATEVSPSAGGGGLLDSLFGGQTANSVTTELTVILVDVNDELPHFNQDKFYGELPENSPPDSLVNFVPAPASNSLNPTAQQQQNQQQGLLSAKVVDRDQGTNGTFTLHLEGEHGHLFEVWPSEATNEATLMIKVAPTSPAAGHEKYFDFERNKELRLILVAREKFASLNNQRRQSQAEMVIHLRDSNDNYPQFDTDLYRVEIPENAQRGMHICTVKASDLDSGPLGSAGVRYTELRGERANNFKLDPVTGAITLRTSEHAFDREQAAQHHLIVEARDNLGLGNRNTSQLMIVLTDVNDQRPKFLLDQYEAFIYENELDFQSPLQVQATDLDAPNTPNSRLTYSIVGGDPQRNFTIDPTSGRIRVRATLVPVSEPSVADEVNGTGQQQQAPVLQATGLDFERINQKRDESRQFNLTIRASDQGQPEPLSATTQVLVVVYDKNDHAPIFSRPIYARSIREDAPGGSGVVQVQAHDGDHSPANSRISYRISSGASDKFVIDSDSGLISVANGANLDIDRVQGGGQRRTSYLLNVLASDGSFGQNQKSSSALVNITVIDVNNKPPEFVPVGIAATGGNLQPLTQSKLQQHQQQQSVVFVNEDAPYGLIVTRVFATDLDSSAELRFSINYARSEARNEDMVLVEPNVYRDVFSIDPQDGTIKVNKQLDRELFDQVKLRLQVEDLAAQTPDQVAHSHLLIRITDVNDNRPTFKRPVYKAVVNENSISGTSVITITGDDRDLNKTLKYSLEASSPELARLVRINPRSGEVTVNDKIDREHFPLINVTIKAEDFGQPHPLTGTTRLVITVRDENDNNPIFLNSTHLRPPTALQARADHQSDQSQSQKQPPNHNMNHRSPAPGSGGSSYRLRSLTGSVPSPQLHRVLSEHDQPGLELDSMASDGQHNQHAYSFGLSPPPSDENGRELTLLAPGATAQVREDAQVGHQIAYVRAEDADVGNNGRVTYLLDATSSGGGAFRIERDSGILSVAKQLDRELQNHYTLIIEACDNFDLGYSTGESRRAFTQVNIQVTDVNDNAPTITTSLHQAATPSASGRTSSLAATSSTSSSPSSSAAFRPSFDDAMSSQGLYELPLAECLFINEFQATNEPILTITATDPDDPETPNGQIDLAIINNPHQGELFSLIPFRGGGNNNGGGQPVGNEPVTITTTGRSIAVANLPPPLSSSADLASDSDGDQMQSSASESDASKWISKTPKAPKRERRNTESASPVDDAAPHQPLHHQTVAGGELQMQLVLSQSLKEKVGNYSIMVRATDRHPNQPLSSIKMVNVCVQDVNNHAPLFTRPPLNHTIRIMENATIGSFVAQVEATDFDHGPNGELQYSLKPTNIQNNNNDWQSFKIDRLTGVISTLKSFNRQVKRHYTLRVQAQDFGKPTSLSSDIDINIMIVNSGKYQPEFEQQQQTFQFTENVAPGREWFKLMQTTNLEDDPALIQLNQAPAGTTTLTTNSSNDTQATNWQVSNPCYYIVDGDDHEQVFHLDRYTHKLTNQRELDREKRSNYTLIVQASNNCNMKPAPTGVHLLGQSTAASALSTSELTTTGASLIVDDRPAPVRSSQSARSDTSTGVGGRLKRELQPIKQLTNSTSKRHGKRISNAALISSEKLAAPNSSGLSSAAVQALDALVASDKSLLKVTIKVKDVNDNAPKFTQRIYTGGITTEADFGTVFMIVQAIDADLDANGQVSYSIVKPIKRNLSLQESVGPSSESTTTTTATNAPTNTQARHQRKRRSLSSTKTPLALDESEDSSHLATTNELNGPHSGGQLSEGDDLFVVNEQTGEISLNFDPQRQMKGYFEFEILARDPDGLSDSARVLIYLLRQDQRVKFVLRLAPQELRQRLNRFRSVFGNITGALVNIDSYKYYENHDGTVDKKKTSLFLHFVQPEDNTIIEVDKVLTLIDNNIEYLDELYKEFHVLSSEAAHLPLSSGALVDPIDQVRTSLMGVASFLALILILVIALCLNQRTRYERQLKAVAVSAFGGPPLHLDPDFHSTTNLPNTNLHSQDPNPIWINGHHHYSQPTGPASSGNNNSNEGHWASNITSANDCHAVDKRKASGKKSRQLADVSGQQQQQQKLFHSGSSGVGMALDDEEDEEDELEELDELSTSGGDQSDLNSLNDRHQSRAGHRYGGAATDATATPRDSLNSSHGQVSSGSSSGANSTSTTNERQILCSGNSSKRNQKHPARGAPSQDQLNGGKTHDSGNRRLDDTLTTVTTMRSTGHNSTFGRAGGAFKEVTIYTSAEQQPRSKQQFSESQVKQKPIGEQQQQQTSQVNRLASQFSASRLHQVNQQHQQQNQRQPIYMSSSESQYSQAQRMLQKGQQQQQKSRIAIHSNGTSIEQGIIKTIGNQATSMSNKHLFNKLDAKFVPVGENQNHNQRPTNTTTSHSQQEPAANVAAAVSNFETSLSKLSILNLETTEL